MITPDVVQRIRQGSSISNKELEEAIPFYQTLVNSLTVLGDKYDLARAECDRTLRMLKRFSAQGKGVPTDVNDWAWRPTNDEWNDR